MLSVLLELACAVKRASRVNLRYPRASRVSLRCRAYFLSTLIELNALLELAYSVKRASRVSL